MNITQRKSTIRSDTTVYELMEGSFFCAFAVHQNLKEIITSLCVNGLTNFNMSKRLSINSERPFISQRRVFIKIGHTKDLPIDIQPSEIAKSVRVGIR